MPRPSMPPWKLPIGAAPRVAASFGLSLIGWFVGTVEVYWILQLLGSPVSWSDALLLESVGQAIRGAAFAIPGCAGRTGGRLCAARIARRLCTPQTGLALSLAKRARELLLGLPGLLYLHLSERAGRENGARRTTVSNAIWAIVTPIRTNMKDRMRAIILAAGRGQRLQQPEDQQMPKCLLRFGGKSLLERHLQALRECGVAEVVLALGFKRELIEAELERMQVVPRARNRAQPGVRARQRAHGAHRRRGSGARRRSAAHGRRRALSTARILQALVAGATARESGAHRPRLRAG